MSVMNPPGRQRHTVLLLCAKEELFSPPVLPPRVLAATAAHITVVCWEWEFL
jgi:hypothetical protein